MNVDLAAVIGTVIAGLVSAAGGLKWWVNRLDAKEERDRLALEKQRLDDIERQDALREELKHETQTQIETLKKLVAMQGKLIDHYMNHIRVLEKQMIKAGIEVPELSPPAVLKDY